MEVELTAYAVNFAELIAAPSPPLGGLGGGKAPQLESGVLGRASPQHKEKARGFMNRLAWKHT